MNISASAEFFAHRPETADEQRVYSYVRELVAAPSVEAIERYLAFALHGIVSQPAVKEAWKRIITAPEATDTHPYILNRCCYTLCNPWRSDVQRHADIQQVILGLGNLPERRPQDPFVRRLQDLDRKFLETEQYATLKRQLVLTSVGSGQSSGHKVLGDELAHFVFLHEVMTTTKDVAPEQRESIRQGQQQAFAVLRQALLTYRETRQAQQRVNPTHLSNQDLTGAIKDYWPTRVNSYRQQAAGFEQERKTWRSMRAFNQAFAAYILDTLATVDSRYASNSFSQRLRQVIDQAVDPTLQIAQTLIVQVCRRVLDFIVGEDVKQWHLGDFSRLIGDVGYTTLMGVLLKIILFCRTFRTWLAERFGLLFHQNEQVAMDQVPLLVNTLEHFNIALALNFETI